MIIRLILLLLLFVTPVYSAEIINGSASEIACPMTKISDGADLTSGTVYVIIQNAAGTCYNASGGSITCAQANYPTATNRNKNLWTLSFTPTVSENLRITCYDGTPSAYSISWTQTVYPEARLTLASNIGINWGDVSNPTTTLGLSNTTVGTVTNGVTLQNDAITDAKIAPGAITSSEAPALGDLKWGTYDVVDLTNEGGDANPTVTSLDTNLTWTANFTNTTPQPIIYFPTTTEESTQNSNCNVQGMRTTATNYNTTTKIVTINTLPLAPDYRCVFRIY